MKNAFVSGVQVIQFIENGVKSISFRSTSFSVCFRTNGAIMNQAP
ncbi:hypothetical protein OROHE_014623 [Orobanche hederae]